MSSDYRILPCGDAALVVKLGNDISVKTGTRVRALMQALSGKEGKGIVDLIPAYCSLTVCFDPLAVSYDKLCRRIARLAAAPESGISDHRRIYSIPVCYGGEFGPDLADVASMTGLSEREVIARHSAAEYFIYMLGFLPGFPYLGGLDPALAVKRLDSPRQKIPCGSVGIGGSQTGVYPMESPGRLSACTTPLASRQSCSTRGILFDLFRLTAASLTESRLWWKPEPTCP